MTTGNAVAARVELRRLPTLDASRLGWLILLSFALLRAGTLAESDTFWQIRTGLLTLHERALPSSDPFSWSMSGAPWSLNSWGFNVILAICYNIAGLPVVALACAAGIVAIGRLAFKASLKQGANPVVALVTLVAALPLLTIYMSARPQLVDYLGALILVLLLRRVVDSSRSPIGAVGWLGVLTVVWVNLHAGALVAVGVVAATCLLAALRRDTRRRIGWCVAALVVVSACSLMNPYGIDVLAQASHVASASSSNIVEWQPLDPLDPLQMLTFVPGATALAIAVRRRDVVATAALAVTVAGSLHATRMLPIMLLLALPVLSSAASRPGVLQYLESRRRMVAQVSCLGVSAMTILACVATTHLGRPDPQTYSPRVVQAIPEGCRLYNSYLIGGYVILERPDVAVSIDSRNDLYGPLRVDESELEISSNNGGLGHLAGADCALLPADSGLADRLDRSPRWVQITGDDVTTLYARR